MVIANVIASLFEWFRDNLTLEKGLFFGVIGTLPAIFWLVFFLVEEKRKKREPRRMISYVFIAGAVSALMALILQLVFKAYTLHLIGDNSPVQLLIFAFMEEFLKFIFVYTVTHKSKFFDEPVDGMLDMITGAMGFAAFENILFMMNAPDLAAVGIFRFIGAILLHAITSGFIGYYWVKGKLVRGILLATLLHFAFNMVVLNIEDGIVAAPLILIFASFFLFRDFDIIKKSES